MVDQGCNQLVSHVGIAPLQVEPVHVLHQETIDRLVCRPLRVCVGESLEEGVHELAVLGLHVHPDAFPLQVRQVAKHAATSPG